MGQETPLCGGSIYVDWAMGAINMFFGVPLFSWFSSIIAVFFFMAVGGGLSYLFTRSDSR